ncbi:hypothetical protein ACXGU2_08350, partial [Streptococcus pyogenes]
SNKVIKAKSGFNSLSCSLALMVFSPGYGIIYLSLNLTKGAFRVDVFLFCSFCKLDIFCSTSLFASKIVSKHFLKFIV